MPKKKLSKRQFVKRFTELAAEYLASLPPEEQDAKLRAVERILTSSRDTRSTPSRSGDTRLSALAARGRHEEL